MMQGAAPSLLLPSADDLPHLIRADRWQIL